MKFAKMVLVILTLMSCAKEEQLRGQMTASVFENPTAVEIKGYYGQAMEPFVSADGQYLFFNNPNSSTIKGDIHYARWMKEGIFEYLGPLFAINSTEFEGAPSMDLDGNFYFTSLINYRENYLSIYRAKFIEDEMISSEPVDQHLSQLTLGMIDMDASISYDGQTLFLAIAKFSGNNYPDESNLIIAQKVDGVFKKLDNTQEILSNVNTEKLEYAASLSEDGLELFFNRTDITLHPFKVDIMVTTRSSDQMPFGIPVKIESIRGEVPEGPCISLDGRKLYYHQKDHGLFKIFRVDRR